ncbi:MAG: hypothetical protein ACKOXZ_03450, partial [Polynucleobacter victoriensis]
MASLLTTFLAAFILAYVLRPVFTCFLALRAGKTLSAALTSSQNVAVGSRALSNASGTYPNTAIGYSSMDSATTGTAN